MLAFTKQTMRLTGINVRRELAEALVRSNVIEIPQDIAA